MIALESEKLSSRLGATIGTDGGGGALFRAAIVRIARGELPAAEDLAADLNWSEDRVSSVLSALPAIERDTAGRVVGAGLTIRETPHVFEIAGRRLFTWCALDTLIFPILLGQTANVSSPCAASGAPVRLVVAPDGVRSVEPAAAVVSIVIPDSGTCDVRRVFCDHVHFFLSDAAAAEWTARSTNGHVVPIEPAFVLAAGLAASVFGSDPARCCGA